MRICPSRNGDPVSFVYNQTGTAIRVAGQTAASGKGDWPGSLGARECFASKAASQHETLVQGFQLVLTYPHVLIGPFRLPSPEQPWLLFVSVWLEPDGFGFSWALWRFANKLSFCPKHLQLFVPERRAHPRRAAQRGHAARLCARHGFGGAKGPGPVA